MKKVLGIVLCAVMLVTALCSCAAAGGDDYVILDESLQAEEYGIAFKKGNTQVHDAVISTLDAMAADGATAEISKKWFGKDVFIKGETTVAPTAMPEGKTTLIMGLDDSFPPMGYRDENNDIVGFDVDLATEVCRRLGIELVLQPIDWSTKELELANGKIDCIWNGLTITPERQEEMLMSRPYLANNQVIVVTGTSIKTKADLEGKQVAVQTASSGEEALAKDEISGKVAAVHQYADYVTALQDLKTGRIDAVILDEVVARYYTSK